VHDVRVALWLAKEGTAASSIVVEVVVLEPNQQ
jgi:hypothetical protein